VRRKNYFNGVSDVESIDKTWMITMGKMGLWYSDKIGMQTAYNVSMLGHKLGDQKA
jgi:hypothetical protein